MEGVTGMLTIREARTRCAVNAMRLQRTDCGEFRVSFAELTGAAAEPSAYYTDDLDDAVMTAAAMRRRQLAGLVPAPEQCPRTRPVRAFHA
jgi:hypothetical protein